MKKLSLILSMMIALISFNANAAMYIVGTNPFGGWDPSKGVEMQEESPGVYTLDATLVQNDIWFIFTEAIGDWTDVNGSRYDSGMSTDLTIHADEEFTPVQGNSDKSFAFSGTAGETYTFTFNTNTGKAMVSGYVAPFNPLTGKLFALGQVNGNNWDPSAGIEMSSTDENIFTLTNAEVTASDDGYGYFSFTSMLGADSDDWSFTGYRRGAQADGTLVESGVPAVLADWGSTDAFKVLPGTYDFEVNLSGNTVTLTRKGGEEPTLIDGVFIIGDVNNLGWDASKGVEMTNNNGIYTAEITTQNQGELGIAYFGFTTKLAQGNTDADWAAIEPYRFGPVSEGAFLMTEELLDQSIELDLEGSYESVAIPEGTWTVSVDLTNGILKINGTWPTDTVIPEPAADVYILGEVNGNSWAPNNGVKMTLNEGVYTANITTAGENDGLSYFSFTKQLAEGDAQEDWDAIEPYRFGAVSDGDFIMTEELLGQECDLATDGSYNAIAVPAGEWALTVDLENNKFTINGEWPETPGPEPYDGDVYILGEVNDNGGWFPNVGVKMTRDAENNVYTATITTAGENDGYSYFSFSKKLAENDWENGGWDEINNGTDRFGAVTDGNPFLVTEEQLGNELSLAYAADPTAFQIEAGQWKLTLSVDNKTLVIEKAAGLRGDVNNDNAVTIGDVTDLIDYLLSGDAEGLNLQNADCNLGEGVTISDVTALIDYLLSGNW